MIRSDTHVKKGIIVNARVWVKTWGCIWDFGVWNGFPQNLSQQDVTSFLSRKGWQVYSRWQLPIDR